MFIFVGIQRNRQSRQTGTEKEKVPHSSKLRPTSVIVFNMISVVVTTYYCLQCDVLYLSKDLINILNTCFLITHFCNFFEIFFFQRLFVLFHILWWQILIIINMYKWIKTKIYFWMCKYIYLVKFSMIRIMIHYFSNILISQLLLFKTKSFKTF